MSNQTTKQYAHILENMSDVKATLNNNIVDNSAIQRALRRLKESQVKDNHVSHYTKHSSHAVKHSSSW